MSAHHVTASATRGGGDRIRPPRAMEEEVAPSPCSSPAPTAPVLHCTRPPPRWARINHRCEGAGWQGGVLPRRERRGGHWIRAAARMDPRSTRVEHAAVAPHGGRRGRGRACRSGWGPPQPGRGALDLGNAPPPQSGWGAGDEGWERDREGGVRIWGVCVFI
jgi:hypothetical protein